MASNDHSFSAPVWTVPSDVQPKSEKAALVEDESVYAPGYDSTLAASAPEIGDLPPDYFDISIVPNNCVLHYNEVTPYTEPSVAVVQRNADGVLSFDPVIEENPDQLWLYLMTYLNEKPTLGVTIHGYHVEVSVDGWDDVFTTTRLALYDLGNSSYGRWSTDDSSGTPYA